MFRESTDLSSPFGFRVVVGIAKRRLINEVYEQISLLVENVNCCIGEEPESLEFEEVDDVEFEIAVANEVGED